MQIYLIQHGDAKPEEEDPERPLSNTGMEETKAIAAKLKELSIKPAKIFHSPKLRARQTAELLASALGSVAEETEGLKPKDNPQTIIGKIGTLEETGTYMFVGHLPHLELLSALFAYRKNQAPNPHFQVFCSALPRKH